MILDSQLILGWQQAVTASAATVANSTVQPNAQGIIDLTIARNIGVGTDKLYLVVLCTATMVGAGAIVTPTLRTSATAASAALTGTINTITTLNALPALSVAGTMVIATLDPVSYLEFLDVYFTVSGGSLTGGAFSAFIATNVDQQTYYAEGFNPN